MNRGNCIKTDHDDDDYDLRLTNYILVYDRKMKLKLKTNDEKKIKKALRIISV